MSELAWVGGEVMPLAQATVPLSDRGYLLGDGLFDTMRTVNGKVWQQERHRARTAAGVAHFGFDEAAMKSYDEAMRALLDVFEGEARLRIQITSGKGLGVAAVTGMCQPYVPYSDRQRAGIDVVTSDIRVPGSGLGIKSISFLPYLMAKRLAAPADDALLTDGTHLVEGTTSNVFARIGDTVYAPGSAEGAVDGVTRQVLLETLETEPRLPVGRLKDVEELWLTNSIGGVIPAKTLDGRPLQVSQALEVQAAYDALLAAA